MTDPRTWKCSICANIHEGSEPPASCDRCGATWEEFKGGDEAMPEPVRWRCTACGFLHEGIRPPTACPVCGLSEEFYEPVVEEGQTEEIPVMAPVAIPDHVVATAVPRWRCIVCGHIHEGTEAPVLCPVCGVTRDYFAPESDAPHPDPLPVFVCDVCGYRHAGEPPPEACPVCGAGSILFRREGPLPPKVDARPRPTWRCEVCSYVHVGEEPPDVCPVCSAGADRFAPFVVAAAAPQEWRCTVCGYIAAGTEAPSVCPVCNAPVDAFEARTPHARPVVARGSAQRVVIVGGGIAGLTAAEYARQTSPEAQITLISGEPGFPYYRLNLTRFLAGDLEERALAIHGFPWFEARDIHLLHGIVASVDWVEKSLGLENGTLLPYDRLVLATGARPVVPDLPGMDLPGVHVLRTRLDTSGLLAAMAETPGQMRCVCIGGGLLGLEAATAMRRRGLSVTVLEGAPSLLPRQLAPSAGAFLQADLERRGIEVSCNARIAYIAGEEAVNAVLLADGTTLEADIVLVATGVRPDTSLARGAELKVERGIVVNDRMQCSDPDIFAAGDAAQHDGTLYGLWSAAFAQGAVAGANAAGGSLRFTPMSPATWLKVVGLDVFSIGHVHPEPGWRVVEKVDESGLLRLVTDGTVLKGANLLGAAALANEVKAAVEGATPLQALPKVLASLLIEQDPPSEDRF